MNKPTHEQPFDLEAELRSLEAGAAGQRLRATREQLSPAQPALARLERRMRGVLDEQAQQHAGLHQGWRSRLPRLMAMPRLAGSLSLLLIATLVGTLLLAGRPTQTASAAELLQRAERHAAIQLAPGQVRHIVRQATVGQDTSYTEELWIGQGQDHLLLWYPGKQSDDGELPAQLADEQHVYTWDLQDETVVHQSPFDMCSLEVTSWVGDPKFLAEAPEIWATRIVGQERLGDVDTTIVEIDFGNDVQQFWIVPETGQMLQSRGTNSETGEEWRFLVTSDEVLQADQAPADLFTFTLPAGKTLVQHDAPLCVAG